MFWWAGGGVSLIVEIETGGRRCGRIKGRGKIKGGEDAKAVEGEKGWRISMEGRKMVRLFR